MCSKTMSRYSLPLTPLDQSEKRAFWRKNEMKSRRQDCQMRLQTGSGQRQERWLAVRIWTHAVALIEVSRRVSITWTSAASNYDSKKACGLVPWGPRLESLKCV